MSEMSTCKHCGDFMRAKGSNNMTRAFCSSRCAGDYRRGINAKRRADQEAQAEAKLEYNRRVMDRYIIQRRIRIARTVTDEGMTTCKAWIPTDSGSRHCGEPATHRMLTRWDGMVSVCQSCYEQWRDTTP